MLPISSKQIVEFTPPAWQDRDPAPVFRIQVPTLVARAQWRRALAEQGARYPSDAELLAAMREDLRALAPDNLDALLEDVDAFESAVDGEKLKAVPDFPAIEDLCRRAAGAFSRGLGDRSYWSELAPLVAAQRFVAGWEHAGVPFRAAGGLVDAAALEALPEQVVKQVGWKAIELMSLDKATEKNSVAPSTSPESPATSTVH